MFELLLQADKSLSEGLLDQAERTYWQLIELDPTNAIAMAGLAMISLERLDKRLARTFAERALGIDPDSIVARRVLQALDEGAPLAAEPAAPDAALRGAEKLEALSRRHISQADSDEGTATESTGREKGQTSRRPAQSAAQSQASDKTVRGGARPGEFEGPASEPLRERRKAGRLAAAAAAAAAAAGEPARTHHEPHHAMPAGPRQFEPTKVRAAQDPFAAAEMAAAVAAVDSMDEESETEAWAEPVTTEVAVEPKVAEAAPEPTAEPAVVVELTEPVVAEELIEPVVAEAVTKPAPAEAMQAEAPAEATVARKRADTRAAIEWPANDRLLPAKATGGSPAGDLEALRRALLAEVPEPDEAATQAEAGEETGANVTVAADTSAVARPEPDPDPSAVVPAAQMPPSLVAAPETGETDAQAAASALHAVTAAAAAKPDGDDWDLSEANAEREALREAVAIVMDEDDGPDALHGQPAPAEAAATETQSTEPETLPAEVPADANAPSDAPAAQDPAPRKKGLFRRIRG